MKPASAMPEQLDPQNSPRGSPALQKRLMEDDGLLHRWTTVSGPVGQHTLVRLLSALTQGTDEGSVLVARAGRLLASESTPEDHELFVGGLPRMLVFALRDGVLVGNWRPRELESTSQLLAVLDVGFTLSQVLASDAVLEDEGGTCFAIIRSPDGGR